MLFLFAKLTQNKLILRKLLSEQYAFLLMLLIGSILLAYNIHVSPLTDDELSAVYRGQYDSLKEVFKYSILDDVHPPLMQFFIYYWLKIVGTNILLIKLPFLLMGIGSIAITYKLAKQWFNANVALLVSCFFISTQLIVMYSQIARPYISGTFLILCFTLQWTKILNNEATKTTKIFYVLLGILCAYNHYFTTLQVAVLGLVGLFFIGKKKLINYILLNVLIGVGFLFFLPTMIKQMNYDGINYIPKPEWDFIFDFIKYSFHYSLWTSISIAIILVASIYYFTKKSLNKFHLISLLLFLLPFVTGYTYSILEKPVMPFRSLIFCFPFLIIFIFSFSTNLKKKVVFVLSGLLLLTNTYSLIIERQHYKLFDKGIVDGALKKISEIDLDSPPYIIFNAPPYRLDFHQKSLNTNFEIFNLFNQDISPSLFRSELKKTNHNELIAFNIPLNFISIIQEDYPFLKEADFGFGFNYYLFSKTKNEGVINDIIYDTSIVFNVNDVNNYPNNIRQNETNYFFQFNQGQEWGPALEVPLGKLISSKYIIVESSVSVKKDSTSNGQLVMEIKDDKENIAWRSSDTKNWILANNKWQKTYFTVQLNELIKTKDLNKNLTLNVYFWNSDKKPISIDNISIKIKKGNRYIYSLLEDFS